MKPRVVLVGGGGHARVILDILTHAGEYEIAGFTSVEPDERTSQMFACPRLGDDTILPELLAAGIRHAFVAIGKNQRRQQAAQKLEQLGFTLINAISPQAVISLHTALGKGIAIMPGAVINAGSEIHDGAIINTNATVDHDCVIGAFSHIAPGTALAGSVKIGGAVLIGVGARVIPGVAIGDHTVVGAGAAVTGDLPSGVLAAGVPAVIKKNII